MCYVKPIPDPIFNLDASAQSGGKVIDSVAKMRFTDMTTKADADGVKYFDLTSSYMQRSGGGSLKDGRYYTHAYLLKWRASDKGWRTLLRHNQDHCLIVKTGTKDLGMYSTRNAGFRDSGYDIVPQQDYWELVVVTGKGASASSHAGTSTLYTVDPASGEMAKRGTVDRVCSGASYYRIGWPGQGPGKIARVMSWDKVLSTVQISQLRNYLSPVLAGEVFDLDASAQSGGKVIDSVAKVQFANMATKADADGVKYFDLTSSYMQRSGGGSLKDGRYYTHAYLLKWRASDKGWRTLLRHNQDHCLLVKDGAKDLGMWSNRNGQFRDSGYDIVPQQDYWEVVVATGVGTSATSHTGKMSLYTMDAKTGAMKLRGTLDRVCSGASYYCIGWPKQGPGKVARVISWDRVLGIHEIREVGRQLEPCKNDSK